MRADDPPPHACWGHACVCVVCDMCQGLIARALRGTVRAARAPPPASMRGLRSHPGVDSRTGERSAAGGKVAIAAARGAHAPPPPRSGGGVAAGRRIPTSPLPRAQRATAREGDSQTRAGATGGQVSDWRVARKLRVEGQVPMHSRVQARRGREGGKREFRGPPAPSWQRGENESPPAARWQDEDRSGGDG